jgi:hypothetical protein
VEPPPVQDRKTGSSNQAARFLADGSVVRKLHGAGIA